MSGRLAYLIKSEVLAIGTAVREALASGRFELDSIAAAYDETLISTISDAHRCKTCNEETFPEIVENFRVYPILCDKCRPQRKGKKK